MNYESKNVSSRVWLFGRQIVYFGLHVGSINYHA